ncbi:hypothetical protein EDD33_1911 [Nocardioides aurantiacus]|uniref:Uncharacterized protein n=1 Tax=Nocardioides aurantiacus TaxID=86796 RepID=A0A3N2CU72_9ACTN|nr:hypothetical protein EDD33_1911 [Nocardioides aurantiacus]
MRRGIPTLTSMSVARLPSGNRSPATDRIWTGVPARTPCQCRSVTRYVAMRWPMTARTPGVRKGRPLRPRPPTPTVDRSLALLSTVKWAATIWLRCSSKRTVCLSDAREQEMAGFAGGAADLFVCLGSSGRLGGAKLLDTGCEVLVVLIAAVESLQGDVAPFVAIGVVAVMPYDVALDGVVVGVDIGHVRRINAIAWSIRPRSAEAPTAPRVAPARQRASAASRLRLDEERAPPVVDPTVLLNDGHRPPGERCGRLVVDRNRARTPTSS